MAASGGYDHYIQIGSVGTRLSGSYSSQAVVNYIKPDHPPDNTPSLYHSAGYTAGGLHASQIYPEQETLWLQSFNNAVAGDNKVTNDAHVRYASVFTAANHYKQF